MPAAATTPLRVLLVTSWDTACGIAAHSELLKQAVEAADPGIEVEPSALALDPNVSLGPHRPVVRLVHLNHHDALHSRWTPEHVDGLVRNGIPVVVTFHDTREICEEGSKLLALSQVASALVIHEPVARLSGAHYWRQGVPAAALGPVQYTTQWVEPYPHRVGEAIVPLKAFPQQPVLGTCGFNFPWKNFDRLAQETAALGWAYLVCSTNATAEDEARWKALNPSTLVVRGWLDTPTLINYLAGCTATAFMYECANTGTSAAIRCGIAARRPLLAFRTCRQFRDLYADVADPDQYAIGWCTTWQDFRDWISRGTYGLDPYLPMHTLAHRDSWTQLGVKYAQLYRSLVS